MASRAGIRVGTRAGIWPESESKAGPGGLIALVVTQDCFHAVAFVARLAPRGRGSFLPRSGRGLSPCARNTIREAISRDTRSSQPSMYAAHAARRNRTRNAAGTFSRSAEDLQTEKCGWPNLSTRRQRAARPTVQRRAVTSRQVTHSHWILPASRAGIGFGIPLTTGDHHLRASGGTSYHSKY